MTPDEREAQRKARLWQAHLASLDTEKPKRGRLTPEERKEHQREAGRRWKAKNREHVNEYSRKLYAALPEERKEARRAASRERYHAMTPEERKARNARCNELRREREAARRARPDGDAGKA